MYFSTSCDQSVAHLGLRHVDVREEWVYVPIFSVILSIMKRGYYTIPPVDNTLNAQQDYISKVIGDIKFKIGGKQVIATLNRYFPVGSIFYFNGNKIPYIIRRRLLTPGLTYEIHRLDGRCIDYTDVERFNSGRTIFRKGYVYEKK